MLKCGFIGGSYKSAIGTTHKIASQMDGRWELVSGCFSRNQITNLETAKLWNVPRVYNNWQEFLLQELSLIDAVIILTPTPAHTPLILKALELGYSVICEKALCSSVEDAIKIYSTSKNEKNFLGVIYNYTGYPMVRELREMIHAGELGRLFQVNIEMPQEGYIRLDKTGNPYKIQSWRKQDREIPTISLDLGVHIHNLVNFLTKESPLRVIGKQNSFGFQQGIIDNISCIAEYSNNLYCNIWYSKISIGKTNGLKIQVFGESGSAEWFQMNPESLIFTDQFGNQSNIQRSSCNVKIASDMRYNRFKAGHPAGFIEAFANYYYDLADALENFKKTNIVNSQWIFDDKHSLEGLKMMSAINLSSETSKWVNI
jgi:predicted dehydrogenase